MNTLSTGESLTRGGSLTAANGRARLDFQDDGNVVLYQCDTNSASALWATETDGQPSDTLSMQADGNLVLYGQDGTALWDSGTYPNSDCVALVQGDGNFVVYAQGGAAVWASDTSVD
jgi:hypothetical protein